MKIVLANETATQQLGEQLAQLIPTPCLITFSGELGAGKTALIRAILQANKISGAIKSPSFALIEPYKVNNTHIYHIDLYRLADPEELEWLGLRDYLQQDAICLIEWPEKGEGVLPIADVHCHLEYLDQGRCITITGHTSQGEHVVEQVKPL